MDSEYYRTGEYYNALCGHGRIEGDCNRCVLLEAADDLANNPTTYLDESRELAILALHFIARLDSKVFQPEFLLEIPHS